MLTFVQNLRRLLTTTKRDRKRFLSYCRRLVIDPLEARLALTSGMLDPTFDGDGLVRTDFGTNNDSDEQITDVAVQSDGKIVAGGYSITANSRGQDFALARYNANGSLDTTFGVGGKLTTDFGTAGHHDSANRLAIQSDGKIVAVGMADNSLLFAVARYNSDGSLDASFDGDGKATIDLSTINATGYWEAASNVVLQADGKIVIVGTVRLSLTDSDFAVVRLNADGSLDTTFGGGDGIVITHLTAGDAGIGVAIDAGGKIVVSGRYQQSATNHDFAVLRYNSDGTPDSGFGIAGVALADLGGDDYGATLAMQSDGKIVMTGETNAGGTLDFALVRFSAAGTLDATFGIGGKVVTNFPTNGNDSPNELALQGDGKIVVAGRTGLDFGIARYHANGSLDAGFGTGGLVSTDIGGAEYASTVALQADGRIVAAGYARSIGVNNADFLLARYYSDITPTAGVAPDPCVSGGTMLVVVGSASADRLSVVPGGTSGQVKVLSSGNELGTFSPTSRIVIRGQGGDDDLQVAGSISLSAWVFGGDGNDRMKGGAGHDILQGAEGADLLVGGDGRDFLVGGIGADRIVGNSEDDILIAGTTAHDTATEALCAIMDEWTRTERTYEQRISSLTNGGGANGNVKLVNSGTGRTVFDDSSNDVLTGSSGLDWFFFDPDRDRATDLNDEVFANDLAFILA